MAPESYNVGPIKCGPTGVFLKAQTTKPVLPPPETSLVGQTAIITGANIGIGFACAEWLLELNITNLILAVRTVSKGEAAAETLRKKLNKDNVNIYVWPLDMLSYQSVQGFAARCQALDRLDFAILNAGTVQQVFKLSPEGHEEVIQVNYLSTVLLAFLLLPTLKAKSPEGKPGRLTIVNSGTAYSAKLAGMDSDHFLATFDDKLAFDPFEQYPASKALAHFWIVKLAERVRKEDVVVNLVDPGLVKGTGLHRDVKGVASGAMAALKSAFGRSMRNGASTLVDAAVVQGDETHGCYVMNWTIFPYITPVYGAKGSEIADRLWDETLQELSFVNIEEILDSLSE